MKLSKIRWYSTVEGEGTAGATCSLVLGDNGEGVEVERRSWRRSGSGKNGGRRGTRDILRLMELRLRY